MSFLGLVGIPATPVTYPVYQALKAATPALGAAFASAEAAAIAAITLKGAAVLGAGALGWMIGSAIREQLEGNDDPGFVSDWITGGTPNEVVRVQFEFNNGINPPINSEVDVRAPMAGILRKAETANDDVFFMRQINPPADVPMVSFNRAGFPDARIRITGLLKQDGTPAENFKRVPAYPQLPTYTPTRTPVIVPATPRTPPFPITPIVVPTPGNDPDEDNKLREPGVTVQIPELGLQLQYTPTGVRIGRYRSPETAPYDPPKIALPPGTPPPASDPCECDEGESKDDEIICRIKTLQAELLDDGYETDTHLQGPSSYLSEDGLPDEFYRLEISVTEFPANAKRQYYSVDDATVTWVGWLSWNFGSRKSDRIPLQFTQMGFRPPEECTGYTIAMNTACKCSALALTRKKKPYIDNCDNLVLT